MVLGWLKGGHPERMGALATIIAYAASTFTHGWRVGSFYAGDAALDLAMTVFFIWLALRSDRWWPLLMTGVMALTLLVHVASLMFPHIAGYAEISARIGLGLLSTLILLSGVAERWLAGESAVSMGGRWLRRRAGGPTPSPSS